MKKYNYAYITTNLANGKQYVGDHSTNNLDDTYLGSGKIIKDAVKKYGKKNFKREILEQFSTKEAAFNAQEKYINEYNTLVPNGYNISPTGGLNIRGCHSEKTKRKIANSNKGKKRSKEQKRNASIFHTGKIISEITKEKISKSRIGNTHSKETKEKISYSKKEFFKNNISPLKNTKRSEEIKRKISKTKKLNPLIYTDEIRLKMSLAKKGKIPWNKGKKFT